MCVCQGHGKTLGAWLCHSLSYSCETMSLTELCSLVLARLGGQQGISVPHHPAQLVQVLEAMLGLYVGAQDPKPGIAPVQQGLSPTAQSLQLGNAS